LIFDREHPWGKEIQICSNEFPGVTHDLTLRGHRFIYVHMTKTVKNLLMNHWAKTVSIVDLDPQALLTIGTHIVKNIVVFIMMSGERLGPSASC